MVAIMVIITRAICFLGLSVAYTDQSASPAAWQSSHDIPSAAEKTPMVPMNSFTGMPFSTCTFLKTCSAIGGAAAVDAACPLVITTAESQTMANTATPAIDCFDLCVIAPPTIPIPITPGNASLFRSTYSRIDLTDRSRE